MYDIKIASMHNLSTMIGYTDIRVDRRSVLGNPYWLVKEEDRQKVIAAYRKYLWNALNSNQIILDKSLTIASTYDAPQVGQIYDEIKKLTNIQSNIRLLCWCAPRSCHADVIKSCILWARNTGYFS